jgi:ParB-like chromosome segregation protein Spo0J
LQSEEEKTTRREEEIKINPEYQSLVSDLSDEEYESLTESIKENGLFVPIVVNQAGIILDGHHRYKIYQQELKQPIPLDKIEVKHFDDPLYEKLFVIDINLNRRQLNKYQKSRLVLLKKPVLDEIAERNSRANLKQGDNIPESPRSKNLPLGEKVNELLGEQIGVSKETIRKVEFIEEKATEEQKQKLEQNKVSIDRVFKELDGKQKLEQVEQKKEAGEVLTDEEILRSLGISIRPYSVWNFSGLDNRFGMKYRGQIPADIVFNTLYFFTKPNDLVVDFMAGVGVTGDVCNAFNRRCLMYDISPVKGREGKHEIVQYDITDINREIPQEARDAELFFWDPPYYKKKAEEYGTKSISALTRDEYLDVFKTITDKIYNQTSIQKIALLVSDYDDEYAGHPEENIFVWDYVNTILKENGYWRVHRHIHCPLSTQQLDPQQITRYVKGRKLYGLSRSLVIFYRNK